jgi:hypothetical protein
LALVVTVPGGVLVAAAPGGPAQPVVGTVGGRPASITATPKIVIWLAGAAHSGPDEGIKRPQIRNQGL